VGRKESKKNGIYNNYKYIVSEKKETHFMNQEVQQKKGEKNYTLFSKERIDFEENWKQVFGCFILHDIYVHIYMSLYR